MIYLWVTQYVLGYGKLEQFLDIFTIPTNVRIINPESILMFGNFFETRKSFFQLRENNALVTSHGKPLIRKL